MYTPSSSQRSLFESSYQMSERKRRRLEQTWAWDYQTHCLPMIDEAIFRPLYCADNGAPCKSIRLVVAVLLLQAIFDLTDEETQYHVDFDLRWHLALGLDPCADGDYVSQRTLQYFRVRLAAHPVVGLLFDHLLDRQMTLLGTQTGQQRLDSTQIRSNFARLSRLGVFCETHRVLLRALRRDAPARLDGLPATLRRRYLDDDDTDSSYDDARASDSRRRLAVAARDTYRLREALRGEALPPAATEAYALLERLLDEHCEIVQAPQPSTDGDGDADLAPVPVVPKEAKTLTGTVMQTPHDPAVTYSGHKGQGYAVLLAETCDPENAVQLITHFAVDPACESDADRVAPTLEALAERAILPETLLADTSFGSVENVAACARQGVELIAPQPGTGGTADAAATLAVRDADFTVHLVPSQPPSTCPGGGAALRTVVRDDPEEGPVALLVMPAASCAACPRRGWCPGLAMDSGDLLVMIALTENLPPHRRAVEQTEAFRTAYRPRAGIEGTNSELKRGHGLGTLRVRGARRVEIAVGFRVMACNLKRMLKHLVDTRRKANKIALLPVFTLGYALKSVWCALGSPYMVCRRVA
jgi:hypothetical protein